MENQLVEAINYIKKISKKKPTVQRSLAHVNNTTANNWGRESVEYALCVLRAKGVIDEHFKILLADNTISPANGKTTPPTGHLLTPMSTNSVSTQTEATPVSPISSAQSIDFIVNDTKDKQTYNLNARVKALKSFIIKSFCNKKID